VKNAYLIHIALPITSVLILNAYIKMKYQNLPEHVNSLVTVTIISFVSMANVMKVVLDLPFAVPKPLYVVGKQLKPFGEKVDGELHTGSVLNVQVPNIVTITIYVTMAHANRIYQKRNGNVKMILNVTWAFVNTSNVLNAEGPKIVPLDGFVISQPTCVLKVVNVLVTVLRIDLFARVHLAIALNVLETLTVLTAMAVKVITAFGPVAQETMACALWAPIATLQNVSKDVEMIADAPLVGLIAVKPQDIVRNV